MLDSHPFQRLRQIHQLGLTYLVYPGATHRRFEHSLGVMELATRVYDIVTRSENVHYDCVRNILPEYNSTEHQYWRRVVRMGALCHDLGHLPFSHGAEKELLPTGWNHERITAEILRSSEMQEIWGEMTPPLKYKDIMKVALGPKELKEDFSDWEAILSEIIVRNTFGVDRMDYLLRDSLHTGVGYEKFDHYRLIDTLRILPKSATPEGSSEPTLGLDAGGLQSAEALLWARYFMYSQVYFHPVRRIYDIHLGDFLRAWVEGGQLPIEVNKHLVLTDNEVIVALREIAADEKHRAYPHARRIIERDHFRRLWGRNPVDLKANPNALECVYRAACAEFGKESVRCDSYRQEGESQYFPVRDKDDSILQSVDLSDTLKNVPVVAVDFVFIDRLKLEIARKWLADNRDRILKTEEEIEE